MSQRTFDFERANDALVTRGALSLLDALHVAYVKAGSVVFVQPPHADGKDSMWVKPSNGTWKNMARDRVGGDLIALIAYCQGVKQYDALKWAHGFLGWSSGEATRSPSPEELLRRDAEARRRRDAELRAQAEKAARLKGWYLRLPRAKGTAIETYLRETRNIPLDRLGGFPPGVRISENEEHTDLETGEVTEWVGMVLPILRGPDFIGVHKTLIARDGSAKAPFKGARKILGSHTGGCIYVWHGAGGHKPSEMLKRKLRMPGIIGEGFETLLTAACARPDYRAEAWLNLSNLLNFRWRPYFSGAVWLRENDDKPQARAMADKVELHLKTEAGLNQAPLKIDRSVTGSDHNDELMED